jgi:hypothetical protein
MRYLTFFLLSFLLSGCATVSTTKTIEVIPQAGVDHIVVDTNAYARCKDIMFIITCRINMDMTPTGGVDAATASVLQTPKPQAPVTATTADKTTDRLAELDKLKAQKLISPGEYKVKRNEILRAL